jgi:NodT family efflux transporter outer membrane factor (OMF) lipoprotein
VNAQRHTRLAALLAALLPASCAVGPDFERPAAAKVNAYTRDSLPARTASADVPGGTAQTFVDGLEVPREWWMLFQSPELDALVEEALRANPDVKAAQAALRQAQETLYAQRGALFPSVQGSAATSRNRNATGTLAPTLTSGDPLYSLHTLQVDVSYVLDVFGGNRRRIESAAALAEQQRFQAEATYLTLTANVVVAAAQEAGLRAQIQATEESVRLQTELVALYRKQLALGAIAEVDVMAQEAQLAQTQATLPALRKQLALQRDALCRLLGRFPGDEPVARFEIATLHLPEALPVSVPSRLVQQRPDVRAAEAGLHAASAQVGVALAGMLPQITLTASGGTAATQLADLFRSGNLFWSAGASVTQTLFAGGSLLHQKRAAEAALDQAGAQYRAAVLTAFQNVADSLRALQYDAETLQAQVAAQRAAAGSLGIARKAFDLGSVSYLALLNAQQAYQQATLNVAQAQASRLADTAALFQALGGGWETDEQRTSELQSR